MKINTKKVKRINGKDYYKIDCIIPINKRESLVLHFYPDWYNNIRKIRNPLLEISIKTKECEAIIDLNVRETRKIMRIFQFSSSKYKPKS